MGFLFASSFEVLTAWTLNVKNVEMSNGCASRSRVEDGVCETYAVE